MNLRLDQLGLSDEEKHLVRVKIVAGSINPTSWSFVKNEDLAEILRILIQADKNELRGLIKSRRETLNRLLDLQTAESGAQGML